MENNLIPGDESNNKKLEIMSIVTSAIPYLGGPISNILSGSINKRRKARIEIIIQSLAEDLRDFKSQASEDYVRTDEFQELFENTMQRVAEERNEDKRKIYGAFIREAIKSPGEPYDEKIRFLRILNQLQGDHIVVLKAILQEPNPNPPGINGSIGQTLNRRIPNMSKEKILDLLSQLQDMRITKLADPNMMITAHGAEDLRIGLTDFGLRFVKYIEE
jgi:hypothetical protein